MGNQPDPQAAKVAALDELAAVRSRWDELRTVTAQLREMRRQNHFAERIRLAYEGRLGS